ncbi:competence protein ComEC, putative [Entamoeba histolytica HM-3:IMSS]|uniref:Competence protein comEC, putative n=2 Tax=Entamoeba histolytica TaxID=5759 RepID=M2R1H6_ENTHI|nr:competence protein comEC, putative [Entamoeba histolytica KU27]EMS17935.1 competence protein ComEC, putative [Entamoeba histolytica HM-3:IMSS]
MLFFLIITICLAKLEIHVFDVGQADSQLILFPSGYSVLIDLGENLKDYEPTNVKYVASKLEKLLPSKHLDVVVLTHLHVDHYGYYGHNGLWYLFEELGFTAGKYIERDFGSYNGSSNINCTAETFQFNNVGEYSSSMLKWACYSSSLIDKTNVSSIREVAKLCSHKQINPPDPDTQVEIFIRDALGVLQKDNTTVSGNHKGEIPAPSENDYSIGIRIQFGNFVYVTSGDLDGSYSRSFDNSISDVENTVKDIVGSVDVMHANHHGSQTSNTAGWLSVLTPTVSVISCGELNTYNLPNPASVSRMAEVSENIFTTERCNDKINNTKYYEMNDDIIISVDEQSSTIFTISNSLKTYEKSYEIKTNKPERKQCIGEEEDSENSSNKVVILFLFLVVVLII